MFHLYQTIIYIAILLMLFYMEDQWGYTIGILAPVAWLILPIKSGFLGVALRRLFRLSRSQAVSNQVSLVAGISALLPLLMVAFRPYRWKVYYSGLGKGLRTFLISMVIVVVYYGILVV